MASNPMQRKARTSFLLGVLITLIILGAVIGFLLFQMYSQKRKETEIEESKIAVYVLMKDYDAGESILTKNEATGATTNTGLIIKEIESDYVPSTAITSANYATLINEDTITKIALKANTVLTSEMVVQSEEATKNDTREQELNMIVLPTYLAKNDYVDIRLTLPTGEDYIVTSKKKVKKTNETTMWIDMKEEEILTLSNAIVEAYQVSGSKLYAIRYVEPGIQNNAEATYVPSESVIRLMSTDRNILEEAKAALANRFNNYSAPRAQINAKVSEAAETAQESVTAGVQASTELQAQQRADYLQELKSSQTTTTKK